MHFRPIFGRARACVHARRPTLHTTGDRVQAARHLPELPRIHIRNDEEAGGGDIFQGFDRINRMQYLEATELVKHPVACIDCHDPSTMALRVTRPACIEGIRVYKTSLGIDNFDANKDATAQEMRSFLCGQCHVEYHFKGPEKRLTFPWFKGLRVDDALAYYDETGFKDWVHKETGAPVLKAQHPEFEMYNQGVHARSGVACADC